MGRAVKGAAPQRILIVNPFGIGDVLFSTPLVRAVREAFPESSIAYLCNRRTEPILRHNPNITELFIYEKDELTAMWNRARWQATRDLARLLGRIWRRRFDMVIDLSLGERYSFILKLLAVPRRVGFNYRKRGRFLTDALAIDGYHDMHVVEYYRRLLNFFGIYLHHAAIELRVAVEDEAWATAWLRARGLTDIHPLIGIVPAGGVSWGIDAPFRRWSSEGFAAVGDYLADRYQARVVFFGERSDRPMCEAVSQLMHHPALDLSGGTSLGQFVGLLARLDLVICNDGGPLHLAVSQDVKTVSIFGPVDPRVYGPYPSCGPKHRVVYRYGLACRPCYHQFKLPPCPYERACLTMIDPEEVAAACVELLDASCAVATSTPDG